MTFYSFTTVSAFWLKTSSTKKYTLFSGFGIFSSVNIRVLETVYLRKERGSNLIIFSPGPVSVIYLCYRLITLMFHGVRYSLLYRKVKRKYDDEMPRALDYILAKGQLGDWFVLYQLSKNCNPYFFREFIKELSHDLRAKPKKSRSEASSSKPHVM